LLIEQFGWRSALLVLAAIVFTVGVPVHGLLLRDRRPDARETTADAAPVDGNGAVRRALRHPVFWCLAVCFTAYFLTLTALIFHLVPLLTDRGIDAGTIVAAYTVFGPCQVLGRIALLTLA